MWFKRLLENKLWQALKSRPVVLLTGARQTGKISLLQHELPDTEYVTLDYIAKAEEAENNPSFFLNQFKNQVILDEIQYAPSLFREIKKHVDRQRDLYGKWVLTGSQKFPLMNGVSESLAGRIAILHLETLSAKELRKSKYFNQSQLNDFLWIGGFPEVWANRLLSPQDFFQDYIQTYLERDLKDIIQVKNLRDFQRFIRICATRSGQLVNYSDLANNIGVSGNTIKMWLGALETAGIIYLLPPYYANIGKRLIKAPKLYFADHGLMAFLLNISSLKNWNEHPYKGQLWENFVFSEFVKIFHLVPGTNIFFYRDQNGVEIDFVIEANGNLQFVEAKAFERIDDRKLNFNKVIKYFPKAECVLANTNAESRPMRLKNYLAFNPLLHDLQGESNL